MRQADSVWIRLAVRAHRVLLRFAPRRDRERFGAETEDAFRALIRDARERHGLAAVWVAVVAFADVIGAGLKERVSNARRGLVSGSFADIRQSARIFRREPILAVAVTLTLAIVAGPALAISSVLYHLMLAPTAWSSSNTGDQTVWRSICRQQRSPTTARSRRSSMSAVR
jgi:hypothetical protein